MSESALELLRSWQTFYEIVGSAAAALTGLQFVSIAVLVQSQRRGGMQEIRAFATPTVVDFCAALLVAVFMSAPWREISQLGCCLTLGAAFGVAYSVRVLYHARKAGGYKPDAEDWVWYLLLPFIGYTLLAAAGVLLWMSQTWAIAAPAIIGVLFLMLGIHNAWDTITYIVIIPRENSSGQNTRKE